MKAKREGAAGLMEALGRGKGKACSQARKHDTTKEHLCVRQPLKPVEMSSRQWSSPVQRHQLGDKTPSHPCSQGERREIPDHCNSRLLQLLR